MTTNARTGGRAALAGLAGAAALLAAALAPGTASAAPGTGSVSLDVGGKAAKMLKAEGAKVRGTSFSVTDVTLGPALSLALAGNLRFRGNGESVSFGSLQLGGQGRSSQLTGIAGGNRIVVLNGAGAINLGATEVTIAGARARLSKAAAGLVRNRLDLDRKPTGPLGSLKAQAKPNATTTGPPPPEPLTDPYAAVCNLGVTSRTEGTVPGAVDPPVLSSPVSADDGAMTWSIKSSLSSYVLGSGGSVTPIAPATMNPASPTPGNPPTFSFEMDGSYQANDPADPSDDQAVIEGTGEAVFCNQPHGFRITVSNPTAIIDGSDSRLVADVDTNVDGGHTPTQRVDLATLNVTEASPFYNESGSVAQWAGVRVTLTQDGEDALKLCNPMNPGPCDYEAGDRIDPITVSVDTGADSETAWPFTNCAAATTMTATSTFPALPPAPLAAPELDGGVPATGGTINWGLRRALRSSVNAGGVPPNQFTFDGGASGTSINAPGDMDFGDAGDYFTWPNGAGFYLPGDPGETGQLVLRAAGDVGFCQGFAGNYTLVISDPEVVLDGTTSRISAVLSIRRLVAATTGGPVTDELWTSGRVDLASIDVADDDVIVSSQPGVPVPGQQTITWTFPDYGGDDAAGTTGTGACTGSPDPNADNCDSANSNVKLLSPAGSIGLWLLGEPYQSNAPPGVSLNALTVTAVVPEAGP